MFSRSGKSTVSQYHAFNNARNLFDGEKDYSNEADPNQDGKLNSDSNNA